MGNNFNLLWLLLKFSFPLTIILVPIVALYGYLQPWQSSAPILSSYTGQSFVMVGFTYRAQNKIETVSRSYVLIPTVLSFPRNFVFQG